jgi:chemotaxis protein methyltransferase CheR
VSLSTLALDHLRQLVKERTGVVLDENKGALVVARLGPIARQLGVGDVEALCASLRRQPPSELHSRAIDAILNRETSFFRDGSLFGALRDTVLPDLIQRRAGTHVLRIWSAACSYGQEPYSVAMLVGNSPRVGLGWEISILASDISREALARAERGRYTQLEVNRGLPVHELVRHFTQEGLQWELEERIRRMVRFEQINLCGRWPALPRMDLVLMRNVLMYFDQGTRARILRQVRQLLRTDGYLAVGGAETVLSTSSDFRAQHIGRAVVYRPRNDHEEQTWQHSTTRFEKRSATSGR